MLAMHPVDVVVDRDIGVFGHIRTVGAVAKPAVDIPRKAYGGNAPGCRNSGLKAGNPELAHGVIDALRVQAERIVEVGPAKRGHVDDGGRDGPGVGAHVLVVAGDDIAADCPARRLESRSGVRFQAIAEAEAELRLR